LPLFIPGYRIIRELGSGGMATVYLAVQESVNREVALKIMAPALAADRSFSERFLKEAKIVAELQHPNIVGVFDMGVHEHYHYIVMEYVEGGDLKNAFSLGFSVEQFFRAILDVAEALSYAHSKGFIHRDVKAENILFRSDGSAVLTDFGIAKAISSNTKMTGTGMSIGTPHYMSPEQARGHATDERSDYYSLGIVLFECLAGNKPYESEDTFAIGLMHINEPIPTLPEQFSLFQPLIDNLCAKNPEDRYSNVNQLRRDYEKIQGGGILSRPSHATSLLKAVDKTEKSGMLTWLFGGAFMALATVFILYYVSIDSNVSQRQISSSIAGNILKNGILSVSSTPEGARISLNGVEVGKTPAFIEDLPTGKHELTLGKQFYQPVKTTLELRSNEIVERSFELKKGTGGVTITSSPSGAWVEVNSQIVGNTPITIKSLEAGEQTITIGKDKYYKTNQTVTINTNKVAKLEITLDGGDLLNYKGEWVNQTEFNNLSSDEFARSGVNTKDQIKKRNFFKKSLDYNPANSMAQSGLSELASEVLDASKIAIETGDLTLLNQYKKKLDEIGEEFFDLESYKAIRSQTLARNREVRLFLQELGGFSVVTNNNNHYFILKNEVTNEAWNACVGDGYCIKSTSDTVLSSPRHPVVNVSFYSIKKFLEWLEFKTGLMFTLPTYEQWMAASGSNNSSFYWQIAQPNKNPPFANCATCGSQWDRKSTSPVKSFSANNFGLFDMHGNAMEIVFNCLSTKSCFDIVAVGGSWIQPKSHMSVEKKFPLKQEQSGRNISFRVMLESSEHAETLFEK
tara:strand:+ start:658 stop:3051 length:2394 start_codon:yes stop_codon:yes gene_type:complete